METENTTPPAPDNATPTTPPATDSPALERLAYRTPFTPPPWWPKARQAVAYDMMRDFPAACDRAQEEGNLWPWARDYDNRNEIIRRCKLCSDFISTCGSRYRNCSLANFEIHHPGQREAVETCRDYVAHFAQQWNSAAGMLAIGGSGSGKDHLLIATIGEIVAAHGLRAVSVSGVSLFSEIRAAMGTRDSLNDENAIIGRLIKPEILLLSDPIPPMGALTSFQSGTLFEILDCRYRAQKLTFATLNAKDSIEADERMGAQITDRLLDNTVILKCTWQSFRKPTQ